MRARLPHLNPVAAAAAALIVAQLAVRGVLAFGEIFTGTT
ncbi:putative membrane protein [Mycobacteroides abscessus]|nr:putative membrane protein [Mycobacteroides abscessus]